MSTFWRIALGAQLPDKSGLPSAVRGAGAVDGPLAAYGSTAFFPCWLPSVCKRPSCELTAGVCCARITPASRMVPIRSLSLVIDFPDLVYMRYALSMIRVRMILCLVSLAIGAHAQIQK